MVVDVDPERGAQVAKFAGGLRPNVREAIGQQDHAVDAVDQVGVGQALVELDGDAGTAGEAPPKKGVARSSAINSLSPSTTPAGTPKAFPSELTTTRRTCGNWRAPSSPAACCWSIQRRTAVLRRAGEPLFGANGRVLAS